ncbi:MAG: electron transfer flavoprotein subunit alpha/FixB family protein [Gemmatimonadales bacterium]|nr:electron transfer flavoprotein subunit alpha/FixB family protein [Gemmatimonadales bacterium]NIN49141.1 electron transfer flavoprotein subunit alpha/FixB family protein [Gemmatimonadales bacterium]NIP06605.1 electron transfer flavoprotein subunit alpha/FixB family protein [Gemmatimonadales bacterium]NIR00302.1 electron transfer flavoprotein subunit alpha/FixB family protein [Gemmatimonadales bacterium]NIS64635.1 electron transfer flavoprotein subunit alpha/FixB family protein [Gemmatimonadal
MANVLAVLEQRGGALKSVSHEALTAARSIADGLGGEAHALVVGPAGTSGGGLGEYGADKVYLATDDALKLYQGDQYAQLAADRVNGGDYEAVILPATALGKDLGPRLAAKLGCPLVADAISVAYEGGIVVSRPVYAGKAIYTLKITAAPSVICIRPSAVTPAPATRDGTVEEIAASSQAGKAKPATTVEVKQPERAAVDVAEASVVVSGGRGLKEAENFKLIEELAEAMGAAVGASRAVVDAGWRPHAEQVGQTGKTVSPNLYFAIGISGAIQHLAGIRTAKVIVAINRDRDAPIFKVADYGIVGDLFEVTPKLTEEVKKMLEG